MSKGIPVPVLVPMSEAFFTQFRQAAVASDARPNVAGGRWPADAALALFEAEHERLLPAGLATPGSHLFEIRDPENGAPSARSGSRCRWSRERPSASWPR